MDTEVVEAGQIGGSNDGSVLSSSIEEEVLGTTAEEENLGTMAVDKQDKLMEYLEFFWSQVNIPRVRRALRRAGLWDEFDFLTFLTQKESRMKDSMWWFREQQGRKSDFMKH